jgi:predicted  nucleic acid-binding Zn-ribbon protein
LDIVANFEECRNKWEESAVECIRMQNQIKDYQAEVNRQDRKIQEIRRHLETKMEIVNKLTIESERLELRNTSARSLCNAYINDGRVSSEARERLVNVLAVLETGADSKRLSTLVRSPAGGLDTISEVGSTGRYLFYFGRMES